MGGISLITAAHASNIQNGGLAAKLYNPFGGTCATSIAIDPSGFLYPSELLFQPPDGAVAAFERLGPNLNQYYAGSIGRSRNAFSTINYSYADAAGYLYLVGKEAGYGTGIDWVIVKINGASGAELWAKSFNGSGGKDDVPC